LDEQAMHIRSLWSSQAAGTHTHIAVTLHFERNAG
jgi:hypothetical protein